MKRTIAVPGGVLVVLMVPSLVQARPTGPAIICEQYSQSPLCDAAAPECALCHSEVPAHNRYGAEIAAFLPPPPLDATAFDDALPDALATAEALDSDEDGYSNLEELMAGSLPGDPLSVPDDDAPERCAQDDAPNPGYRICAPDPGFTLRRVALDVCGRSPSLEEFTALAEQTEAQQWATVDAKLARCLDSEYWRGKNGVLWQMAFPKVRPIGAIKGGPEDAGPIRGPDYYNDFSLYAYVNTDDRDVRDVLRARYQVARSVEDGVTRYEAVDELESGTPAERRVGMITTDFFRLQFTMAALPRAAAAQAYRAYLGFSMELSEGLVPVAAEPVDWDGKDVKVEDCAYCHSTLDPLSYPFSRYSAGGMGYDENRLQSPVWRGYPDSLVDMPEAGVIFGQPVADLVEWAEVAVQSEAFLVKATGDYWERMVGEDAELGSDPEFDALWRSLADTHDYQIERMLADLIRTEAYSVP